MKAIVEAAGLLAALLTLPSAAFAEPALAIRFCPASQLHSYPLDAAGRARSLLLQGFAVINRGPVPAEIRTLRIDLLRMGRVVESRTLDGADVAYWAGNAAPLQQFARQMPFQFCGDQMIGPSMTLAGPTLARDQALLITRQVFAYDQLRDQLRVQVDALSSGHPVSAEATIPIRDGFARTRFSFPLKGSWYVGWGPSFHTDHRWHPPEEFALDIAQLGKDMKTYRGDGRRFEDYVAYGADVLAAADGVVVKAVASRPQDPGAIQRPDETAQAYAARHQSEEIGMMGAELDRAAGDYVMLDHGDGEFSLYAHLQPDSLRVHVGDHVRTGDVLGKLGSSGNSTEPHLHFQVCDRPDPLMCAGIPAAFSNISVLWADGPRALQSGDIVTTR